jgi:hypothetical protein
MWGRSGILLGATAADEQRLFSGELAQLVERLFLELVQCINNTEV